MANLEKQCFHRNVGEKKKKKGKSQTGPCVCIAHRIGWESGGGEEGSPMGPHVSLRSVQIDLAKFASCFYALSNVNLQRNKM